jgi:hypothetical protein
MKFIPTPLRRIPLRNWAVIYFKLSVGLWAVVLMTHQPQLVSDTADRFFVISYLAATLFGVVVSMVGLVISSQKGRRWYVPVGSGIELGGILFSIIGPLCYGITQLSILISTPSLTDQRVHLIFLAHALFSALMVRIAVVGPRFAREVARPRKAVL